MTDKIIENMRSADSCNVRWVLLGECRGDDSCKGCRESVKKSIDELEKRLMPEGFEWPRFDDGELVKIGDNVLPPGLKDGYMVLAVKFYDNEYMLQLPYREDGTPCFYRQKYGTPVKRPQPDTQERIDEDIEKLLNKLRGCCQPWEVTDLIRRQRELDARS